MVRRSLVLLALLSTWLALPTASGAWNDCAAFGNPDWSAIVNPGRTRCHDTTATIASDVLNVSSCDHFGVQLEPDFAGTGTGCEGYLWRCSSPSYSANTCTKALVDTDGDGIPDDVTLNGSTIGRQGQQYQTATWIYWQPTANPSSHQCRLVVDCK